MRKGKYYLYLFWLLSLTYTSLAIILASFPTVDAMVMVYYICLSRKDEAH